MPGASGNPGGRSKVQIEIQALLNGAGPTAAMELTGLMRHEDPRVALAACRDILDRVCGTAPKAPEDRVAVEGLLAALLAHGTSKHVPAPDADDDE